MWSNCQVLNKGDDIESIALKNDIVQINGQCTKDSKETSFYFKPKSISRADNINPSMCNSTNVITTYSSKVGNGWPERAASKLNLCQLGGKGTMAGR
jgi:hypothetical protein